MARHSLHHLTDRRATGVLWDRLTRAMGAVYTAIGKAFPGRAMTAYRHAEDVMLGGRRASAREMCRPVSPARRRVVEAVEHGFVPRVLRAVFTFLCTCPLSFYGLLGLFYSLAYAGDMVGRRLLLRVPLSIDPLVLCGILAACSILLLFSVDSVGAALGKSQAGRLVFVKLLCMPAERLCAVPSRPMTWPLGLMSAGFGIASAAGVLYAELPLSFLPLLLAALGLCGMIFAYPETGVVLTTVLLPFVWLDRRAVYLLCGLILVTWCAYGFKLLCLHRTLRVGLFDLVVLFLGGYMLVSAFVSVVHTPDTLLLSLMPVIILGDYFLIVNLMTTREYIRRCLIGVAASVVIVTVLAYLCLVPVDTLDWMAGSRAGNVLLPAFRDAVSGLSGLWREHAEIYLVLVFPWLFAYLMHTRRLVRRVMGLFMLAADLGLILMTRSITASMCVAVVTVLFLLLLGPKWAGMGLVSLPAVGVGAWWLLRFFPVSEAFVITLSRSRHFKAQLRDSLWRMVADHPAGIGVGEDAFTAVYPAYAAPDLGAVTESGSLFFEVLLAYGWPGLILLLAVVFVFLQKGFTCLGYTASRRDRSMLLGGIVSVLGALVFGVFRSFLTVPRVFFTLTLVVALCSAYANIIYDESDVLTVTAAGSPTADDRIFRRK